MEIKFIELLGKTGSQQKALFEVGAQKIIIGVAYSFLSSLGIPSHGDVCINFLKEVGILRIQLMIAENNPQKEYIFRSSYLKPENGQIITTREEVMSFLRNKIIEAEDKSYSA